MKTKSNLPAILIFTGLLLIAGALWIVFDNFTQSYRASQTAQTALEDFRAAPRPQLSEPAETESRPSQDLPDYILNPSMPMPTIESQGNAYIGVVDIPALELSLPVLSEWSYPLLQIAPCRYTGSAYSKDMIVMAHNYWSHFGQLKNLHIGDPVYFTDTRGNVFPYTVTEIESLEGDETQELLAGQWDLTLFTCTIGGQYRVTVRCQSADLP